jgi:hypothetical protein
MAARVPPAVTREELEAAFPWVCHLPPAAIGEFLAAVEIYRQAAEIYRTETYPSRHRRNEPEPLSVPDLLTIYGPELLLGRTERPRKSELPQELP